MGKFKFTETLIEGVYIIEPTVYGDSRGYFMETYNFREFAEAGLSMEFVQDNQSKSARHVLRGLHFQKTFPQGKLVRVTKGEVYDVAVDIRPGSATYGRYVGVRLSEDNRTQFYVPEGCAHGFLVLSEDAEFVYKCTQFYHPEDEASILWNDPDLAIEWPLEAGVEPLLSDKDRKAIPFARLEQA